MRFYRLLPALLFPLMACGIGEITISINPKTATVPAGGQLAFTASVGGAGNKNVIWTTSGGGTVDATGHFQAPVLAGTCTVTAQPEADPSKLATATVTVTQTVAVSPATAALASGATQAFTATVIATGDTNFTWSVQEGAAGGTIDATGLYTAPGTPGVFHVLATSVADPTQVGIAVVTVGGGV
jgi:acyl-coenzyme A thioesterase PaaI-like protein